MIMSTADPVFFCDESFDEEEVEFLRFVQNLEQSVRKCMEQPATLTPSQEALVERIREAFSGITVGPDTTLYLSGVAEDHYQSEEFITELRRREIREDWQSIPPTLLAACDDAIPFLDAEGMRYLLPAYMLTELHYPDNGGIGLEIRLSARNFDEEISEYLNERLSLLTERQRDCVTDCIRELRLMECDESMELITANLLPWEEEDRNAHYPHLSDNEYAAQDLRRYCEKHGAHPGGSGATHPPVGDLPPEQALTLPGMEGLSPFGF